MNPALISKAKKIKLVITDIDGVWTDAKMYYSADGMAFKAFSYYDGMGVSLLKKAGLHVAIITGEFSKEVEVRAKKLNIEDVYLGESNKLSILEKLLVKYELTTDEVAYIGDDINDYECMQVAGFTAAPPNTPVFSMLSPDILLTRRGGDGAFREFADIILLAKGLSKN
jgi:3-deoxy-D-manno-octulosonate 8-phosphate phosphatase (KDO 8-P phosphatase)